VAPLDWGLGHAARCIPLIRELQRYPVRLLLAAEEPVLSVLREAFPHLEIIPLKGYQITYSRVKRWMFFRIGLQTPRIILRAFKENLWLRKIHRQYQLSAIISDNRFGLYHPGVKSIYITHQLQVKTGHRFADRIASAIHRVCIRRFTECWVPDSMSADNLAGSLSHTDKSLPHLYYIGPLSRLESSGARATTIDLLLLISGPEPQRSLFEKTLLEALTGYKGTAVLVRGLPAEPGRPLWVQNTLGTNVQVFHHLDAKAMESYMNAASLVICRSGYTTVMDLVQMRKKAVLIPTPGQAEQEYLATHLQQQQYFCSLQQENFSLEAAIRLAKSFSYQQPSLNMMAYPDAIKQLVESL